MSTVLSHLSQFEYNIEKTLCQEFFRLVWIVWIVWIVG